ncbi:MAG: DUF3090 domain-containing protein [Phototrophicales bacterium]|nr:MAG: DUF3090 domain-containing protein [Phototrophicales bacterium]
MPNLEIELDAVDFITVGTIGPKGKREFHIQAGQGNRIVTLKIEKEQARQLATAIEEILEEVSRLTNDPTLKPIVNLNQYDMSLRDPVEPMFRVERMGLGYDEERDRIILVAQEWIQRTDDQELEDILENLGIRPSVARFWGTREQYKALSEHTLRVVEQGRADPRENGYLIYYWT